MNLRKVTKVSRGAARGVYVAALECGHVRYFTAKGRPRVGTAVECKGLRSGSRKEGGCV